MGYELDFGALLQYLSLFAEGTAVTLGLTAVAAALGLALSIAGAAAASGPLAWARRVIGAYVEFIRNTPFIVQMFFVYFGLPSLGLRLSAMAAAVLAMTINLTAYAIEIMRAGIAQFTARIFELRERGFRIDNEMQRSTDGRVLSRYWLRFDPERDGAA